MAQADAVTLKAVVCVRGMLGNVGVALACGLCLLPAAIAAGCQGPEPTLIAATAATSKPAPAATVTLPPRPTPTPSPAPDCDRHGGDSADRDCHAVGHSDYDRYDGAHDPAGRPLAVRTA